MSESKSRSAGVECEDVDLSETLHADYELRKRDPNYVAWQDEKRTMKKPGFNYLDAPYRAAVWSMARRKVEKRKKAPLTPDDGDAIFAVYKKLLGDIESMPDIPGK